MEYYCTQRGKIMSYIHPVHLQFRDIHRQQGNTHHSSHRHHHSHRRTVAADSPLGLVKSEASVANEEEDNDDEDETHRQTVSGQELEFAQDSRSGKTTDITFHL